MFLTGQTLDMISMFALMMTLGIIVDDAIVVGEHTATRYAMGDSRSDAAINGAGRMAAPVIAASLTTMAAFGPLLMIEGFVGAFMGAIPMVVMAVLVASLVECFLILPGHLAHTLPKERRRPWWFRRHFDRGFAFFRDRMFGWFSDLTYRWRYVTVSAALGVAMIVGALLPSGMIGFQFFPSVEGEVIRLSAQFQPGIPEERMAGIMTDFEAVVSGIETDLAPEGETLFVTTYASLDVAASNAWLEVYLTPSEERTVRSDAIRSAIEEAVPSIAGVERMNVREFRGGPPSRAIDIALSGSDIATLKQASEDVQEVLEGFPGINSLSDTLSYGSPEMTMTLTDRGAALGFDLNSLGTQIRDAFEGRTVRRVAAGEEEIAIRLQRGSEASGSDALRSLWVRAPSGGFVPISSVVSFGEEQTFRRIFREDGKTTINVQADVDEGAADTDELVAQLNASYLPEIAGQYGITYSFEGTQADQEDAFADLRLGAFVALGVMYIIIAWIFASYTAPLAVMLIIPFGVVGAIWGHYVMGFDLTFISAMGLLGLSGILVNDSIVLISRLQDRLAEGESLRGAATGAARDRLRAVVLTSLTTIGGLTPILFETSLQAQLLIPMAITIVFGLGVATALVLFIVPAFMGIGADVGALLRWIFLTPGAPSFKELVAGAHHDRPRSPEAAE
jgi:multidrug efflux pump subunit AcrB